ncbi:DUF3290 domain-containing protein [Lactobacillus hominis]|uniref:DUF3290 domain-containing protein n=1 Tax=Lactobacillus hominis DSM 23910 = CRBIP 24.179 TaxID=1423758 RepID=I7JUK7_9LACO|nr:DUF3290 domain-containing protein [Lactobacillus hominis]KRM84693.1 hypothetical protein FC41_GL000515 [Lactobacillus hominis DSM 23910 = CRBIP 24.179]MCT3348229.1 DUF3290 domain-containing protein [Lactobacillus hominis]CCI81461.1 Putative uncharacterized protein [Lactobacillus hominis DSM 23910 = CRBIP 24.179]
MTFYTIDYIQNNQNSDKTTLYILMFIAAVAMIIFAGLYLRDRFATRYRDLGIIALLFLLLFAGTQYEKYQKVNAQKSQTTQIIPFLKSIARDENVKQSDVMANSTTLVNGMIVRIDSKNIDYQLNLNDDNNSYTLTRAHVIDHKVEVKK